METKKLKLKVIVLLLAVLAVPAMSNIIVSSDNAALWAGGTFSTGKGVTISSSVASGGTMSYGNNTSITGDIYSGGNIWLGNDSSVTGNVTPDTAASLSLGHNIVITGSTDTASLNFDSFNVAWQAQRDAISIGTDDISGGKNSTTDLLAGAYHNLSFNKNATLNMSSGTYSIGSFYMNKNGIVNLDTSGGDITLNVLGSFSTGTGMQFSTTGSGQVYINVYDNDAWLGNSSQLNAALSVYGGNFSTGTNAELAGQLYSTGDMWLGNNTSFEYVSSAAQTVPEPTTVSMLALMTLMMIQKRNRRPSKG